jgi:alkanesulfonate monooxygenase SsuD/methylene tetrahydromethanopterin reductase-like flavin-dependent oxidoreductase (luciferase family)
MKQIRDRIGAERGWGPMQREQFDQDAGPHGSLYVGSPETVARKIATTAEALDLTRFDMKYSAGRLPHAQFMRSIELYGSRMIPLVRDMLS